MQATGMDGKTLKLLQQSGVVKNITVVADHSTMYVHYALKNGETGVAQTTQGKIKQWATIDATVKWLKTLGFGSAKIDFDKWKDKQKQIKV
mgnify:CR=1 FL=1